MRVEAMIPGLSDAFTFEPNEKRIMAMALIPERNLVISKSITNISPPPIPTGDRLTSVEPYHRHANADMRSAE